MIRRNPVPSRRAKHKSHQPADAARTRPQVIANVRRSAHAASRHLKKRSSRNLGYLAKWIKHSPIKFIGALGALTAVSGFIAGVPPAWRVASQWLGIPECVSYSNVYYYWNGHFRHQQAEHKWIEYQEANWLDFEEVQRDRAHIVLHNLTPRPDSKWQLLLVRLPVCDGMAQWTHSNPDPIKSSEPWHDLIEVKRTASSAEMDKQREYEASNQPKQGRTGDEPHNGPGAGRRDPDQAGK